MTLLVAITGGIGSGKSTFSKEVLKRKLKLLDSDKQVNLIYSKPSKDFKNYLKKIGLGSALLKNKINKKTISEVIFFNKEIKKKLEKYIFEIIRKERSDFIKREKKLKTKIIFFDIPLLFENNLGNSFDTVISIISSKKERWKRLKKSKKISKEVFQKIVKSQTKDTLRKANSDIVIYNNKTMKNYLKNVNKVLDNIIS
tara:strand:+ start:1133 stop:1729 length:597 start_codon:yes stop_codon:yes gene_type:complete